MERKRVDGSPLLEHGMIVNGLEEARAALGRGERVLESPPFAACHAGVGYYVALIAALAAEFPAVDFTFVVCCGDDAATAHDALRQGVRAVRCAPDEAQAAKLQAIADGLGARLFA